MPQFSEAGNDMYICQVCGGNFDSVKNRPTWRPDITKNASAGNVCQDCLDAANDKKKLTKEQIDDLVDIGLNAACYAIQEKIGQNDGGIAGIFFSGRERDKIEDSLRRYIETENLYRG